MTEGEPNLFPFSPDLLDAGEEESFVGKSERRFIESARNTLIATGQEARLSRFPSISSRGDKLPLLRHQLLPSPFIPSFIVRYSKCESREGKE